MYLIPAPAKLEKKEGRFIWAYDRYVTVDQSCSQLVTRQASLFCDGAEKELGYRPLLTRGAAKAGDVVFKQDDTMKAQSYVLDITEDAIVLTGDEAGLWHGMQTLLQIIEQEGACLSALHIEDAPAIVNRGYYFDCTRGRIPKLSWLKQLADRMAYYKLNQLQLYVEHSYLFRGMTELWRDDTPLTAEEIMEFDRYCAERGIELVPSLSSFGHLYKLLCSREYSHLCELEDSEGKPFSQTGRMAHHTINTSDPESLQLIEGMISEYMELFTSRQFNICADETFDLGRGRNKEAVEKLGKDRVYINYVKKLAQFLLDNGRRPMFWGDIIVGFPGETEEQFQDTLSLVREVGYDSAFTFIYSPRTGTGAAKMPNQVPEDVSSRRIQELLKVQEECQKKAMARFIGTEEEVLVEGLSRRSDTDVSGHGLHGLSVTFPGTESDVGEIVRVKIVGAKNNTLTGERI